MIPLAEIVSSGLCIGCGLCESIAPGSIEVRMTGDGVERPIETHPLSDEELALINRVCPGLRVELEPDDVETDPMWGPVVRLAQGHAGDPYIRFRSATGGILTALGVHLLDAGRVERVLHVAPNRDEPTRWSAQVSTTPDEVVAGSGSRYGPAAPLTPVMEMIEEGGRSALIAKPCDAAAVRNLISEHPRAGAVFRYVLVMACGGASKLTKHWQLLQSLGIEQDDVVSLRHRGYGNPGPTTVTTRDGQSVQRPYRELWEDESKWELQWRCKVCPDGMGEVADLVALDCWPGGVPEAEDPGFNGIITRTPRGDELLESAIEAGVVTLTDDGLAVDETLESWQPHQSRRKAAIRSRLAAMQSSGLPVLKTKALRLDEAEIRLTEDERRAEFDGALARIRAFGCCP